MSKRTLQSSTSQRLRASLMAAVLGDMAGSVYEGRGHKTTDFPLLSSGSRFTDDTVMTIATARALLSGEPYAAAYRELGRRYPRAGYGRSFGQWLVVDNAPPYQSFGNGSAMRVSPVAWAHNSLPEVLAEAERSAAVTHDHAEGIKGAQAVAVSIFLAHSGTSKEEIRREVSVRFGYDLGRTVDAIRPDYRFDMTCQGSVPEALLAFLDASSAEDAIRLAVSLGGDADTQACIAGSIAGAFWGHLNHDIEAQIWERVPEEFRDVIEAFDRRFGGLESGREGASL